jgi:hypothetical protein
MNTLEYVLVYRGQCCIGQKQFAKVRICTADILVQFQQVAMRRSAAS